jgi:competence/damage-inducible protein CinA-like protein
MVGTELLLGQIVDTNAAHMGRVLAENGINLYQKTTVGDNPERIVSALRAALDRADVVLVSGGLGPTEDDITRECVAEVFDAPLEMHQDLLDQLKARFSRIGRPITDNNSKQACIPRGATAIPNPNGTAPGIIAESEQGIVICMPGVPKELYAMLEDTVIPFLRDRFEHEGVVHYRVLKVCGVGESRVDTAIGGLITASNNPKIGLLASPDAVKIRISARARNLKEANALIDDMEAKVRGLLPGLVMGVDGDTLEGVVGMLLVERSWRLAISETITGGMMAQRFTAADAQGFAGGIVTPWYNFRGQDPESAAQALARVARERFAADCGLALVANPEKHDAKAVFQTPEGELVWDLRFAALDEVNQLRTSVICVEHIRRALSGLPDQSADPRLPRGDGSGSR